MFNNCSAKEKYINSFLRINYKMSFSGIWISPNPATKCCNKDSKFLQLPTNELYVFDLTGFFYTEIPKWYDVQGRELFPLDYRQSGDVLLYRWQFAKLPLSYSACDRVWYLKTSEDVVPVITETITNTPMNVQRIYRIGGYTLWKISC